MATQRNEFQVEEILRRNPAYQIVEAKYQYQERNSNGKERVYGVKVSRQAYEELAATISKPTLPFDKFVKVLRPLMMGTHAAAYIPGAFNLLDSDNTGTIDISEIAAFMPVIVPGASPHMLLRIIQKVDQNRDYKLNLNEFTNLVKRGIGREIAIGRM
ncbi:unnamed protein product [Rotaria sordida]|uniref:EF-hand domain-containing protein n=1 Tax=Rotaria sordida TaxID=392033 RepID=A0A814FQ99_9BILA|nr:unnamed protein product [Rotaria sordida]CAF0988705.1 unnamed protein product [Rotaria sordida]CAF3676008.1 unnamed protein product [Rotaria sordida]CAF4149851.1 unnamed protein product [Rotaria sordida]